jgi:uroporphyrinogen III methyltransferase / synthase
VELETSWRRSVKVALNGKTILTTRAAGPSGDLTLRLKELGARVVECPTVELEPIENCTAIDHAIRNMKSYQWLMFTSANAVDYFMKRIAADYEVCRIPIAVVGSTTAKKLEDWKLKPALVPERFNAEGLLEAFPKDLSGVRILFPRAEVAREILPEELRRRGAIVDVLPVYRTKKAVDGVPDMRQIFRRETLDCVVFTSPSAIRFMAETLEEDLGAALNAIPIAVIGPVTARACEPFGLHASIEPKTSTIPDLVEAIRRHFVVTS